MKLNTLLKLFLATLVISLLLAKAAGAVSEIEITLQPPIAEQGKTLVVIVESTERLVEVSGSFRDKDIKFYPWGYGYRGIIGIDLKTSPSEYELLIMAIDVEGNPKLGNKTVKVKKTKFPKMEFTLVPAKRKLLAPEIIASDLEKIEKAISSEGESQIWRKKFLRPVRGKITMPFGTHQIINGKGSGQHRGTDFRGISGSPIKAANDGVVVLAQKLMAHGNTVIIDHGQGIFTTYLHLRQIKVKKGSWVGIGQVIGTMGSTGVATGVHLHWGMMIHGTRVDPMQWIKESKWRS